MKYLIRWNVRTEEVEREERAVSLPAMAVAAAMFILAGLPAWCQASANADEPVAGLVNPQAVVFNATTGKVYSVDADRGIVHVSDDRAGSTIDVKVGAGPVSIAVNTSNGRAYVANAGDGTVSVLDGKQDAVVATVTAGSHPYSIAADSMAGKVYVSRTYSNQLMILDAATNEITGVQARSPDLIAVNARTNTAYLLGYEGGSLTMMTGTDHDLAEKSVGMHAWGMALNPQTGALFVAKIGDAKIAMLEPGASSPRMIATGQIPCSVAINPRTNMVYVANYGDNSVTAIDEASGKVIATIPVGERPEAVAVDPEHNLAFAANTKANSVTVIDGVSHKVLATLDAGIAPYALAMNPAAGKLHVANLGVKAFTILDVSHLRSGYQR